LTTQLEMSQDMKRIPLRFQVSEGKTIQFWVKNKSGATLTTGAVQEWIITVYGRWV